MIRFKHFFNPSDTLNEIKKAAFDQVHDEKLSGRVGYYRLPQTSLALLEQLPFEDKVFEQIVVIGIGGSSLGIKAIHSLLASQTPHAKEMIFFENSDPLSIQEKLHRVKAASACFCLISKSGTTIETTSIFKTIMSEFSLSLDNAQNIITITDKDSALDQFAQHHHIRSYHIPDNVGGRFSVLSAVGVIPLQLAGFDVKGVLEGAQGFVDDFFEGKQEHLLEKAAHLYQNSERTTMNVLFVYSDALEQFSKWYVQLWAESLGKIDSSNKRVGLTPISLTGAVDQHSFLQLIMQGPADKSVTFIEIEDFESSLSVADVTLHGIEKTDFINTQSFNTLINAQCEATMQSLIKTGIDVDQIQLDKISAENAGVLIVYYELLTSLVGAMFKINTYDQPGVELGKKILYQNLGNSTL